MLVQHLDYKNTDNVQDTSIMSSLLQAVSQTSMLPVNTELALAPTVQLCERIVTVKPRWNVNQFRSRMKQSLAFINSLWLTRQTYQPELWPT